MNFKVSFSETIEKLSSQIRNDDPNSNQEDGNSLAISEYYIFLASRLIQYGITDPIQFYRIVYRTTTDILSLMSKCRNIEIFNKMNNC